MAHPLIKKLQHGDRKLIIDNSNFGRNTFWNAERDLDNPRFKRVKDAIKEFLKNRGRYLEPKTRIEILHTVRTNRGHLRKGAQFDIVQGYFLQGTWIKYKEEPLVLLPMEYQFI